MAAQQRKAIIVGGAAGPQDVANGVLARFGFGPAASPLSVAEATALLRGERYDLVVVPLQNLDAAELAALERELRRYPGAAAIGTAPHADSELIVRGMRFGVQEFLVYPPEPTDFAGAVERIVRRLHTDKHTGVLFAVFSGKGGLGTSSVAANLAFTLAAAQRGGRVGLAELVAGGDLRVALNLRPHYDVGDLLKKIDQLDAELLQSLMTPCTEGVWVLPAAEDEEVADGLGAAATARLVEQLRGVFPYTVLDCEHHMSDRTLAALDAADRVLLVTQLDVAALHSAKRTLGLFQRLGYADEKIVVVVNRHQSGGMVTLGDAATVLRRPASASLPNDYHTSSEALTRGVPAVVHAASTELARAYGALAAQLGAGGAADGARNGNGKHNGHGNTSRLGRIFSIGKR
ncbi:hypothetical protein tb265_16080 [Gemmatimonadetes bacterium T265]|nr:hypothetical protein tb265_16080 [Gemmatimonadetes bacterium T265]